MKNLFTKCLCLLLVSNFAHAQSNLICQDLSQLDVEETSLEQLMEVPVFLGASQQATCTNEAANIVNSISGEEILTRGARDLTDILKMIPSFTIGVGLSNTTGIGIRGMGGDEGGISVFVDGIMMTDNRFGITPLGGRFPVEQIDRIEIVRGSSSITNGNFAQLGVINIITKNAKQANGLAISTDYGRFERGDAQKKINVSAGKIFDDLEISFSGKANESQRSDRIYTDAHGSSFDMANNSQLDSIYGNFSMKYKELQVRFLAEEYNAMSRDGYADSIELPNTFLKNKFSTYAAKTEFEHPFTNNFKINSVFDFSRQIPWERSENFDNRTASSQLEEKVIVDHYKFNGRATWMSDAGSYFTLGNSYQMDDYTHVVSDFKGALPLFTDYTAYAEGVYKTDWVDVLLGLRFDAYSQFGTNLAPRVALTKQLDKFHYKFLYADGFHAPTGGDYQLNVEYNQNSPPVPEITPETTHTYEMELGYAFSNHLDVVSNIFFTQVDNLFYYTWNPETFDDYYINIKKPLATYGFESSMKYKNEALGKFELNYGFYQNDRNTQPAMFQITNADGDIFHPKMNLGFPTHKTTLNHTFQITPNFSFNHNIIFFSDRFGYNGSELVHYKPDWIYNTYLRYQNIAIKGFDVGLGLYDVFNARDKYIQEYNGTHPALPAESRELMLRLSYKF